MVGKGISSNTNCGCVTICTGTLVCNPTDFMNLANLIHIQRIRPLSAPPVHMDRSPPVPHLEMRCSHVDHMTLPRPLPNMLGCPAFSPRRWTPAIERDTKVVTGEGGQETYLGLSLAWLQSAGWGWPDPTRTPRSLPASH